MKHAGSCVGIGQEMDHAACRQMDRGRARNGSCSMPADVQRQGRRWIMQHVVRWTEAGQEIDHTACRQLYRGRAGYSSGCRWIDWQLGKAVNASGSWLEDGQKRQDRRWTRQQAGSWIETGQEIHTVQGRQIDSKGRQMKKQAFKNL